MSNHWDIYFCYVDDKYASFLLDMDIWKELDRNIYSYPICLRIYVKNPSETGFPIDQEADLINNLENCLINDIGNRGFNVGRVTTDGVRDVYFYFKEPFNLEELASNYFSEHGYEIEMHIIDEEEPWGIYFNYLYPNKYEIQHIRNSNVIDSLRNSGDTTEKPRRVDHWINLGNSENTESVKEKAKSLNFEIECAHTSDEELTLQIFRTDYVDFNSINEVTDLIIEFIDEFDAEYDGWETQVIK